MGKKRKSAASSLDEVDRTMYTTFCSAASSLSQLYTQATNHQKLTFQAGERNGLEKLYQWIRRQQEAGSRVATADVLNYIQNELDYVGEEQPSMSPRAQPQNTQPIPSLNSGFLTSSLSSGSSGPTGLSQVSRASDHCDHQSKNSVFSNALSSPVRRTLQSYHIAQGGGLYQPGGGSPPGNGPRNNDTHSNTHSNDSSMDI